LSDSKHPTAKINRKLVQRTVVFLVIFAAIGYGAYWLLSKHSDPDLFVGPAGTVGDVAAIETVPASGSVPVGYQAVVIKPDSSIVACPDYVPGAADSNLAWRPDGGRLFFESDRYQQEPHLYRWNPDTGLVERRTTDKRPKGVMSFASPGLEPKEGDANALMIAGGTVVTIDANTGETKQLLPPNSSSTMPGGGGEAGAQSAMEKYSAFGTSFVKAMWSKDKHYIVAVMNRESGDQALIIQDMTNPKARPQGIVMGKYIGLDVAQSSGRIAFSVVGSEVPDWYTDDEKKPFIKNGKIVPPLFSLCALMDLENQNPTPGKPSTSGPILRSPTGRTIAFGSPSISPDEKMVVMPVGVMGPNGFQCAELIGVPFAPNAGNAGFILAKGNFSGVTWTPDSSNVVAISYGPGTSDVVEFEAKPNGATKNLTQGKGTFVEAAASPQKAS
jgi:hypothetical protein